MTSTDQFGIIARRIFGVFLEKTLANIKSAKKRARQSVRSRAHNMSMRSMMRTMVKKVGHALDAKDATLALTNFKKAESVLDNYARKGLIHKNKAARHKSRLTAKIKALAATA